MKNADHQLSIQLGGAPGPEPPKVERAKNRAPPKLPNGEQLPLFDGRRWISRKERLAEIAELNRRRREALKRLPLWADVVGFHPTNDPPPKTRGDCPDTNVKPCPFVKCRMHLYRNDNPAGRPGLARVPRDEQGHTKQVMGDVADGDCNEPVLDATAWMRWDPRPSCALDVAEQGPQSNQQMGEHLGRHRTLAARLVKQSVVALHEAGGDVRDLIGE